MRQGQPLRPWEFALMAALCVTMLVSAWTGGARTAGWWCVMFPPLTPRAAEAMAVEDDTAPGEYEIRFRVLELWEALRGTVKEHRSLTVKGISHSIAAGAARLGRCEGAANAAPQGDFPPHMSPENRLDRIRGLRAANSARLF